MTLSRPLLPARLILALGLGLAPLALVWPAAAQSTGYVTGFPGKDPAGDDEIGWGPAYRPETSFSQPGTPPTPGDFAGAAYRARTERGPYDRVQDTRGTRPVAYGGGAFRASGAQRPAAVRSMRHGIHRRTRATPRQAGR
ncbi:hypothetical protein [Methylobacterium sp. A54F]